MSTPTELLPSNPTPSDPQATGAPGTLCLQCPLRQQTPGSSAHSNPEATGGVAAASDPFATGTPGLGTDPHLTSTPAVSGPSAPSGPSRSAVWTFGHDYEILERVAQGGMGGIYKARQVRANRLVALKMIQPGHLATAEQVERFRREAQAAADLHHPGIVTIHNVGEVNGQHYFSMEWLDGGSLKELLAEGPLPPRLAAELMRQAAEAVEHAHQRGIIHRDIKPHNIMLDRRPAKGSQPSTVPEGGSSAPSGSSSAPAESSWAGVVKLIDFGLVRQKEGSELSRTGLVMGTPSYMPPEQARGELNEIGPWSDVYGLGAVLYQLLTGRPPFQSASEHETLRQVLQEEPVPPKQVNAGVPTDLEKVCLKCLHKERARRYSSAGELAADLSRFLRGEPVKARPVGLGERARKWCRRNPALAGLALALVLGVLALVGGTVSTSLALARARAAEKQAETDKNQAEAERALAQALTAFLQKDVLGQADVGKQRLLGQWGVPGDPNITVREMLDRAAPAVEKMFKNQPLMEAEIRLAIGDTYRTVQQYDKAQFHLERSLALYQEKLGEEHFETLGCKNDLAVLCHAQANYVRAEALLREVLNLRERKLGTDHPDTLASKHTLATVYYDLGLYDTAETLLREVLELRVKSLGADHLDTLTTKNNLGMVYYDQSMYDRAEGVWGEVVEEFAKKLGAEHPGTLASKRNLADLFFDQGKLDRAEQMYREVLQLQEKVLGPEHTETLVTQADLAYVEHERGNFDRAETLFRKVLEIQEKKLGVRHLDTLSRKYDLAWFYRTQKKYDRAEQLYREVAEWREKQLGAEHRYTLRSKSMLALVYQAQGNYDRAEQLYREVLELQEKRLGRTNFDTLASKENLAGLYQAQGKYDRAEPRYREVLELREKKFGAGHAATLETRTKLATLYQAQGKYDCAEPLLVDQLTALQKTIKKGTPQEQEGASVQSQLGIVRLHLKKHRDAERVLRDCLATRTKVQPDDWSTFYTMAQVGAALAGQKKYEEAEKLLLSGYEGMKARADKIPPQDKPRLLEAIDSLVKLYEAQDKKEKAEEWRKQLPKKE